MIGLSLQEIADVTGGTIHGDRDLVVKGSAFIDSRACEQDGLFVAIVGDHVDGHDFAAHVVDSGAAAVLAIRAVDAPCVVVGEATVALGKIAREVLDRRHDLRVIGLTGSQGKTSTKDLLSQILAVAGSTIASAGSFNNELGVPLTVLRAGDRTSFLVVEMGSRGIGHIETLCTIAPPDIGVVLNVGTAHVGEFGSVGNIARAKGELIEALPVGGTAILNADDPRVLAMSSRTDARIITFGEAGDLALSGVRLGDNGEPHFTLSYEGQDTETSVPLLGTHQAVNAAAAAAVGIAVGMNLADIGIALENATAQSPMRMAKVVREDGVVVINDAYNANPDSMAAALRALAAIGGGGRTYAVLGEMLELGDSASEAHRAVGVLAAELGITCVVAVGDGAAGIAEGAGPRAQRVADVDAAVSFLTERLHPPDVVIVKASRSARLERVVDALLGP